MEDNFNKVARIGLHFFSIILLASLLATFLFYPLISRGMEITPDGVDYLKTASNVAHGYGFSLGCPPREHPNRHWPPGYSALIAAFLIVGVSWIHACKIIAIACYIILLCGISFYIYKLTGSLLLSLLGETASGFHPEVLRYAGAVLSEPLSWLFLIGISAALTGLLINRRKAWALSLGILLGLSMLVRYAYVPLGVICVALFLLLTSEPWPKRLRLSLCICIPAAALLGGWIVRNMLLFGEPAKSREPAGMFFANLWDSIYSWSDVLFHTNTNSMVVLLWAMIFFLGFIAIRSFFIHKEKDAPALGLFVNLTLAFGYTLGLVLLKTYETVLALNNRKFTQIILLFVLMLAFASAAESNKFIRRICCGLLVLFCVWSVSFGVAAIPELKGRWLGFYEYQKSPTLQLMISRGLKVRRMISNASEGIWLWTGKCTHSFGEFPQKVNASSLRDRGFRMLVWFKWTGKRADLLTPQDVEWDIPFERKEFPDGYLYQLKVRPNAGRTTLPEPVEPDEETEE